MSRLWIFPLLFMVRLNTATIPDGAIVGPRYCKNLDDQKEEIVIPYTNKAVNVPCSQGWVVFQRRKFGNVSFQRTWQEYKDGFGEIDGDFWLGLENLYEITRSWPMTLQIKLEFWSGTKGIAYYSNFELMNEKENNLNSNFPKDNEMRAAHMHWLRTDGDEPLKFTEMSIRYYGPDKSPPAVKPTTQPAGSSEIGNLHGNNWTK
ncbi:ficolin-3-like [Scaptodrosophila lebanonensis]|uniref:Ficolin-3-like n=1 Tax=Drosophila lebanonensis TaxID=7225 RepID=A0A6J2TJ46_DROLE|nr:ficolin-3-like [Scaptodrosophila lebanonensis]